MSTKSKKAVASKEKENVKLQNEIIELREYAAGAPTTGTLFDKEDNGKSDKLEAK